MRLGIDFGTTRTVVAYADRGNYPVVRFTDDAGDTIDWFPSVIAEHEGKIAKALAEGGKTSSMEREIRALQETLKAAQRVLERNP